MYRHPVLRAELPADRQRHYDLTFIALVYLGNRMLVPSVPIHFGFRW